MVELRLHYLFCALALSACVTDGSGDQGGQTVQNGAVTNRDAARSALANAMARRDEAAIAEATAAWRAFNIELPPELPERYQTSAVRSPDRRDATTLARSLWPRLVDRAWWRSDPVTPRPLREPAKFIQAALIGYELTGDPAMLDAASEAGDYLISVQRISQSGVFGFPVPRGNLDRPENRAAARFLAEADANGIPRDRVLREGWIIEDLGNGDLNYDNGLVGEALFSLYRASGQERFRNAAVAAAEWALTRPIVPNYNYNGFTVALLAAAYDVTAEQRYLEDALVRARLGVLSGQEREGPLAGSWIDPHNRRHVYRFIMVRQLSRLRASLPDDSTAVLELDQAIRAAVVALEREMDAGGGLTVGDAGVEAYCALAALEGSAPGQLSNVAALSRRASEDGALLSAVGQFCFLRLEA